MTRSPIAASHHRTLTGWRAQGWALVLFVALLRGLVPHAALASAMMPPEAASAWCLPGSGPSAAEPEAVAEQRESSAPHACICATSADAAGALPDFAAPLHAALLLATPLEAASGAQRATRPPPATGPPLF